MFIFHCFLFPLRRELNSFSIIPGRRGRIEPILGCDFPPGSLRNGTTLVRRAIPSFELNQIAPSDGNSPPPTATGAAAAGGTSNGTIGGSGITTASPRSLDRITDVEQQIRRLTSLVEALADKTTPAGPPVNQEGPQTNPAEPPPPSGPPGLPYPYPYPYPQYPAYGYPPPPPPQGMPPPPPVVSPIEMFIPPATLNPAAGRSFDRIFHNIDAALRMTIARHEFKPIQLYKLDPLGKEAFKAKTFEFSEDGVTQRDREPTSKDYPTQRSLFQPFGRYLQLLHHFVIAAGNTDNSLAVVYATLDYANQLHAYAAICQIPLRVP
ncbi:hypothetical protein M422DRAFT_261053 [Sphaerobolus stellatus SS14]|uniref:Uncharacterized protein n=1 Tax=Sphaerobolus stellatus (strain SS14) TaxID=990650 RepID=A0A0C9VGN0_SPHS4|nr:hypothetical protein M422DRAFT_261053 [Sphaerobolus stellatus SS14]